MDSMIHVELKVADCVAEVWLNGIPIRRLDSRQVQFVSVLAHSFLVDGPNTLELIVNPGATPSLARNGPAKPGNVAGQASVRLVRHKVGEFTDPDGGEVMLEERWSSATQSPTTLYPLVLRAARDFGRMFGPWAWQSAAMLNLARDRDAIVSLVSGIHKAFSEGRGLPIAEISSTYLREEARAVPGVTFEEMRGDMLRDIAGNAGRVNWVAALDPEQFDFRICANGRLVECIDKQWQPLIHTLPQANGEMYPFPMFLGKVGGGFQILR